MNFELEMSRFGYTPRWIEYGILTEAALHAQIENQKATNASGFEHYRYATLVFWLRNRESSDEASLLNFIEVALSDPDEMMGGSALAELLDMGWLTDPQFEIVAHNAAKAGPWIQKRIVRASLRRELLQSPLDQALFEKCLEQKDGFIHRWLLDHPKMTHDKMLQLSQKGFNKAIRNAAEEASRNKKRWIKDWDEN